MYQCVSYISLTKTKHIAEGNMWLIQYLLFNLSLTGHASRNGRDILFCASTNALVSSLSGSSIQWQGSAICKVFIIDVNCKIIFYKELHFVVIVFFSILRYFQPLFHGIRQLDPHLSWRRLLSPLLSFVLFYVFSVDLVFYDTGCFRYTFANFYNSQRHPKEIEY